MGDFMKQEQELSLTHSEQARRAQSRGRRVLLLIFSVLAVLIFVLAIVTFVVSFMQPNPPVVVTTITFARDKVYETPSQLAMGGQSILSMLLDPTGQHLVYGAAGQAGVMYTTDLANPLASNQLATRSARDVAWAPDGSALVTTIYPAGAPLPLLALVPVGQYMHLLGEQALAASWLPSSAQAISSITYITEARGQATLWQIAPDGKQAHVTGSMSMSAIVQQMSWSPDGRFLAILATAGSVPTRALLQGPRHLLYLFDTRAKSLAELAPPANNTITALAWSRDGHMLTYALVDGQGGQATQAHTTLYTIDPVSLKVLFSLALQSSLLGMSWSPDNRALVYSDGGTLHAYVTGGTPISFNGIKGIAAYPAWLDSQHLLYLSIVNGNAQLARLVERVSQVSTASTSFASHYI